MKLNFSGMSRVLSVLVVMRLLGTLIFMGIVFHVGTTPDPMENQRNDIKRETFLRMKGSSRGSLPGI